jgi:hypothetical protein
VLGTVELLEFLEPHRCRESDATMSIELDLKNTTAGSSHPAHIHFNTAAEGGDIAFLESG